MQEGGGGPGSSLGLCVQDRIQSARLKGTQESVPMGSWTESSSRAMGMRERPRRLLSNAGASREGPGDDTVEAAGHRRQASEGRSLSLTCCAPVLSTV